METKNRVSVKNFTMSDRRAEADITVTCPFTGIVIKRAHVHTNNQGCGLWIGDRQVTGTSQFGVTSAASARAAFRRWFE